MNKKPIVVDDPRFLPSKKNKKKVSKKLYKQMNANFTEKDLDLETSSPEEDKS